jgi:hypothetical protein
VTGPEHYREAERLLIGRQDPYSKAIYTPSTDVIASAQVHATLALAAPALGLDDSDNWTVPS